MSVPLGCASDHTPGANALGGVESQRVFEDSLEAPNRPLKRSNPSRGARPRGSGRDDGAPRAQVGLHKIAQVGEDAFQLILRRWCVVVAARVETVADHLPLTGF